MQICTNISLSNNPLSQLLNHQIYTTFKQVVSGGKNILQNNSVSLKWMILERMEPLTVKIYEHAVNKVIDNPCKPGIMSKRRIIMFRVLSSLRSRSGF